jgi:hypothetical protein
MDMSGTMRRLACIAAFAAALGAGGCVHQPATAPRAAARLANKPVRAEDFVVVYPGVYTPREAELVRKYLADNAALKLRGPLDVPALIHGTLPPDTPGLGPVIHVTEAMVRYDNAKYDWENPLRSDAAYARAAGFQDILAYPTFGAHDDTFMVPWPVKARDTLLVSDLNHSVTSYRPGRAPQSPSFADIWEAPEWRQRPAHFYTDADWARIKAIWAAEQRRGAEPRYWEDVNIGDAPTLDGQIFEEGGATIELPSRRAAAAGGGG